MRIGWQSLTVTLLAVVCKMFFSYPTLEKSAGVNTGRGVRLKENEISALSAAEEMIETGLKEVRGGRIAG